MKIRSTRREFLLTVIASACLCIQNADSANILVGTGDSTSYLVLQSSNLGVRTYEVRYDFNASSPQDGYFLLTQVFASDPGYSSTIYNFGSEVSPNYFVDSITYDSVTETGLSSPPYEPYWAHWVSDGEAGFPTPSPIPSGTWTKSSGLSAPYRRIAPESWDALYFSDGDTVPAVAPVPETSSSLLAIVGTLLFFTRRRKP